MPATRVSLVTGPAKIVRGTGIVFSQDDIPVNLIQDTLPIITSAYGEVDQRALDARIELSFTPEGRWNAATLAFLWPYGNTAAGASIFGTSDTPTTINASDGALHTIIASAVTAMPSLSLSAARTIVGPVTITGVRKNNTAWATADGLYTIAAGATMTDTTWAPSLVKVQHYTGAWGAVTGFTAIGTQDGWSVDFDLQLDSIVTDDIGTVDMRFRSLGVLARCMPVGPTPAQILTNLQLQDTGAARGRSMATANDLVITGADTTTIVTLKQAALKTAGFRFGATVLREGEIGFFATRPFSSGVQGAIFTLE
jgi:hypothetical protein